MSCLKYCNYYSEKNVTQKSESVYLKDVSNETFFKKRKKNGEVLMLSATIYHPLEVLDCTYF